MDLHEYRLSEEVVVKRKKEALHETQTYVKRQLR